MGLAGGEENGNAEGISVTEFRLGSNKKYKRMGSTFITEKSVSILTDKKHDTKKFVIACAIFASLNSVLLGYGWFFNPIWQCYCYLNLFLFCLICYMPSIPILILLMDFYLSHFFFEDMFFYSSYNFSLLHYFCYLICLLLFFYYFFVCYYYY